MLLMGCWIFEAHICIALQFSQKKADDQIRWAVLNVTQLLRTHRKTHEALSAAMARGASVGECITVVEQSIVVNAERLA